jgi:hypothetical protein
MGAAIMGAAIMGAGPAVAVIMGAGSEVMEVAVTAPGIADHCSPSETSGGATLGRVATNVSPGTIGLAIRRWRRPAEAADFGQPSVTRWRITALPATPLGL